MLGFVSEGIRECGRKAARFRLRGRLKARGRERQAALATLGRSAWEAGIDLAGYEEWRDPLAKLDAKSGELTATSERLEREQADLRTRREAEVARFDAAMRPAAERRSQVDAALKAARAALSEKEKLVRAADAQAAQAPTGQAAGAPGRPAAPALPPEEVAALRAGRDARAAEVARLATESQQCAADVSRIDAERKAALQPLDDQLKRLKQQASGTSRERTTVSKEQAERFVALGAALYDRQAPHPEVAAHIETVDGIDRARVELQATIDASAALSASMPRGTMLRFTGVLLLLPVIALAALAGGYIWLAHHRLGVPWTTPRPELARGVPVAALAGAAGEQARNQAVEAFIHTPGDRAAQDAAVRVLVQDLLQLGGTADPRHLPALARVLRSPQAQLRSAAADAMGMIGPTAAETPALLAALNDPVPAVREKALRALRGIDGEPHVAGVLQRAEHARGDRREPARSGAERPRDTFAPDPLPDQSSLGVALYPGATFLYFASDVPHGRAAFATSDPPQKVAEFYAALARRPAVDGHEFSRLYFGGSPADPSGAGRIQSEFDAWVRQAMQQQRPAAEMEAEMTRAAARQQDLPLVRYADTRLFGSPTFVALESSEAGGQAQVTRYAVVFEDIALGKTGVVIHVVRKP